MDAMRRRLRRHLLRLGWVASLVLLVAIVALWMRSYWAADVVHRFTPGHYVEFFSDMGHFGLRLTTYARPIPRDDWELEVRHEAHWPGRLAGPRRGSLWSRLGFS